jgi:hypothetical protein
VKTDIGHGWKEVDGFAQGRSGGARSEGRRATQQLCCASTHAAFAALCACRCQNDGSKQCRTSREPILHTMTRMRESLNEMVCQLASQPAKQPLMPILQKVSGHATTIEPGVPVCVCTTVCVDGSALRRASVGALPRGVRFSARTHTHTRREMEHVATSYPR